jgi:hypothetical protein
VWFRRNSNGSSAIRSTVRRWTLAVGFCAFVAHAAPPPAAQVEINYLLSVVANSGCEFFRNGTWYDGKSAAAHLQGKYQVLAAKGLIGSSADFIERAATRSSVSNREYAIKCEGSATVSSHAWLTELLVHYRESRKDIPEGIP